MSSEQQERSIKIVQGLVDQYGNPIGQQVIDRVSKGKHRLTVVYGQIKAGKSTLIEGLMACTDNLIYLPFDYIYDNAQESNLGLEKPFKTKEHFEIFDEFWEKEITRFRTTLRRKKISANILTDVPKFRCTRALTYFGLDQYLAFEEGLISGEDILETELLPMINDPRNKNDPGASRVSANTVSAFDENQTIRVTNPLNKRFNPDEVIYKNVTGINWDQLIKDDERRIIKKVYRESREGLLPDPKDVPLPEQFNDLGNAEKRIIQNKIVDMEDEIDFMGFNPENTPILMNYYREIQFASRAA